MQYNRNRPRPIPELSAQNLKRFMDKYTVDKNGCWIWGEKLRKGYGKFHFCGNGYFAHRVAYSHWKGQVPEDLFIDHLCRNRACVNPNHMEAVSHRENVIRGEGSSAQRFRQTHCVNGHPLTPENVRYRKDRYARNCKVCEMERTQRQKAS
jgi:hypothetical protein